MIKRLKIKTSTWYALQFRIVSTKAIKRKNFLINSTSHERLNASFFLGSRKTKLTVEKEPKNIFISAGKFDIKSCPRDVFASLPRRISSPSIMLINQLSFASFHRRIKRNWDCPDACLSPTQSRRNANENFHNSHYGQPDNTFAGN